MLGHFEILLVPYWAISNHPSKLNATISSSLISQSRVHLTFGFPIIFCLYCNYCLLLYLPGYHIVNSSVLGHQCMPLVAQLEELCGTRDHTGTNSMQGLSLNPYCSINTFKSREMVEKYMHLTNRKFQETVSLPFTKSDSY